MYVSAVIVQSLIKMLNSLQSDDARACDITKSYTDIIDNFQNFATDFTWESFDSAEFWKDSNLKEYIIVLP